MRERWPVGLDEIKREFGDPTPFLLDDGLRVQDQWPEMTLARLDLPRPLTLWNGGPVRSIMCHQLVRASLGGILTQLDDAGLYDELNPWGGCYNWRLKRGSNELSTHGWAIAIDPRAKPCNALGLPGDMPPAVIEIFAQNGWTWGGTFRRRDPAHFQACGGY
jgi:hypothetical protein